MQKDFWKKEYIKEWAKHNQVKMNQAQKQYLTCLLFEFLKGEVDSGRILLDTVNDLEYGFLNEKVKLLYLQIPEELSDDFSIEDIHKKQVCG